MLTDKDRVHNKVVELFKERKLNFPADEGDKEAAYFVMVSIYLLKIYV